MKMRALHGICTLSELDKKLCVAYKKRGKQGDGFASVTWEKSAQAKLDWSLNEREQFIQLWLLVFGCLPQSLQSPSQQDVLWFKLSAQ